MIQRLWDRQVDEIIDVKLGDADADTYKYEPITALLDRWEKTNKYKHGKHYHDQHIFFPPFVLSVDGMIGREAVVVLSQFIRVTAEKREEPLSILR